MKIIFSPDNDAFCVPGIGCSHGAVGVSVGHFPSHVAD